MILPHLEKEKYYWNQGMSMVAGIDEAGRGPLAGPVVAAAVVISSDRAPDIERTPEYRLIRDSKTLSARQREKAYELVTENYLWGIGWSDEKTIDRVNILQAAFLAMKKAISDLKRKIKGDLDVILLDGRSAIPNISIAQENIVQGDRHVFSISAASIIAKVTRDKMMMEIHEKFPAYGFARHKGYGTKYHFEMLENFGPSEIHRKSFRLSKKGVDKHLKETKIRNSD